MDILPRGKIVQIFMSFISAKTDYKLKFELEHIFGKIFGIGDSRTLFAPHLIKFLPKLTDEQVKNN